MKKCWLLVSDSYMGLEKYGVDMLAKAVAGYIPYVLPVKTYKDVSEKELQEMSERGMQMQQDAQQELQRSWLQMLEPIAKKIDDAIKSVGQEGGYVYIFDLNATSIPFVNETLSTDVTGAVKAKLGLQ